MTEVLDFKEVKKMGKLMISTLDLKGSPIGVKFILNDEDFPEDTEILKKHRYCQALMKANKGLNVVLTGEEISCPAAASAFGSGRSSDKCIWKLGNSLSSSQKSSRKKASLNARAP